MFTVYFQSNYCKQRKDWNHFSGTFAMLSYLAMFLVLASHYRLGTFFGARGLFTSGLVGICVSGAVVAILANLYAAWIVDYIKVSIAVLGAWTVISLLKTYKLLMNKEIIYKVLFSLFIITFVISLNNVDRFLYTTDSDDVYLSFNSHYSYLSVQSSEMLSSDYPSRLRVSNQYPEEWAAYHFLPSGVLAIVRLFLAPQLL